MSSPQPTGNSREIHLYAQKFQFTPEILQVDFGDEITLILQSNDVLHGIEIIGYNISMEVFTQAPKEISFIANKEGNFKIICTVSCGEYHPYMQAELKVGNNKHFFFATSVVFLLFVGFVVHSVYRFHEASKRINLPVINKEGR